MSARWQRKKWIPRASLIAVVFPFLGCGPTLFQGQSDLQVMGELPPPPPPPPKPKPPPEPPAPKTRVQIVDNKIVITEKIQFEFNEAVILDVSHSLLDEIADLMQKNPHVKKVRVEGHASLETDTPAKRRYNKELSDKRARAVMEYLVGKGVDASRLEAHGFGVEQPIVPNDTEEGREKNRRVEFNILEQDVTSKQVEVPVGEGG